MAITEQQILDALRTVRDPDKGADIVTLGMVSGVVVRDGNVGFAIEVEPSRGAHLEPLRKAAEQVVEALPGVLSVTAVLTAETGARTGAGRGAPPAVPQGARPALRLDFDRKADIAVAHDDACHHAESDDIATLVRVRYPRQRIQNVFLCNRHGGLAATGEFSAFRRGAEG